MSSFVSVVMPVYNGEKYLKDSIESILGQSYPNLELILVNDGSTDSSAAVLQTYVEKDSRVVLLSNSKNTGIPFTRNVGIKHAKYQFIANMDQDDIAYPNRLGEQVAFLQAHPEVSICIADLEVIDDSGKFLYIRKFPQTDSGIKAKSLRYSPVPNPLALFKKEVWEKVSGYNESLYAIDDYDFWLRALKIYKIGHVGKVLQKYRFRESSTLHSAKTLNSVEKEALKLRFKAVREYDWRPSASDIVCTLLELAGMYVVPPKLKVYAYQLLRKLNII